MYPRSFNLSGCLGRIPCAEDKQEALRWLPRVKALSFATQVITVYKMIHAIVKHAYPEFEDFDAWFRVKHIRL